MSHAQEKGCQPRMSSVLGWEIRGRLSSQVLLFLRHFRKSRTESGLQSWHLGGGGRAIRLLGIYLGYVVSSRLIWAPETLTLTGRQSDKKLYRSDKQCRLEFRVSHTKYRYIAQMRNADANELFECQRSGTGVLRME